MLRIDKKVRIDKRDIILFGPVCGGGRLFVSNLRSDPGLVCLDAATLEESWRRQRGCFVTAFANRCLIADSHDRIGEVFGISETGADLWQRPTREMYKQQWFVWRDQFLELGERAELFALPEREHTDTLRISLPSNGSYDLAGDTLIATTWAGTSAAELTLTDRVLAFDLVGQRLLWQREVFAELRSLVSAQDQTAKPAREYPSATVTGGSEGALLGRCGAWLFGVDRQSGRVLWTQRLGHSFGRPRVHNGRVLEWIHVDVPERPWTEDWLVSIDQVTGAERYRFRLADVDPAFRGYQRPWGAAFLDDLAVFTADHGLVAAFKEETGELVWLKDLKKKLGAPVAYQGRVYFCDNDSASVIAVGRAPSGRRVPKARTREA